MKTIDLLAFGEPMMEFAEVQRNGERLYLPGFGGDVSNTAREWLIRHGWAAPGG